MKKIILTLYLLAYPFILYSQQQKIDSLITLLNNYKSPCNKPCPGDSVKVKLLVTLAFELSSRLPDTALILSSEALKLSEDAGWVTGIGVAYHNLGWVHFCKSEYAESFDYNFKALEIWDQLLGTQNTKYLTNAGLPTTILKKKSSTLGNIGLLYNGQGEFLKAFDYYYKALKMAESIGEKSLIARHLGNLGLVYWKQRDYSKALDNFNKALKIEEGIGDQYGISRHLGNIGLIYDDQGANEKALEYYYKALAIDERLGNKYGMGIQIGNIGVIYSHQKKYRQALEFYEKALKIDEELGNKHGITRHMGNIGLLYSSLKDYVLAEKFLQRSLLLADSIGDLVQKMNANKAISELYMVIAATPGLPDKRKADLSMKAMKHFISAMDTKDSIFNMEKSKEMTSRELMNDFEKKEGKVKALQEKKDALATAEIARQKIIRNAITAGTSVILISAGISFLFYKRRRDAIERQKEAEFDLQVSDVEMKALRAQMNPHFIFNSLNSIHRFIQQQNVKDASAYTIKFSRLMRLVLENSEFREVELHKDLEALNLYMELEALRMDNRFEFEIKVDEQIDPENTLVPPLILQPFIENSIWHGLMQKETAGKISIHISKEDEMIKCVVEDNGIGREKSMSAKKTTTEKKSLGMKITKARIDIINKIKKSKAGIELIDLSEGMRVIVRLPLELGF